MEFSSLEKTKDFLKRIGIFLFRHHLIVFVIALVLIFAWASLIFYQYGYKASSATIESKSSFTRINDEFYEKIIDRIEEKEKRLEESRNKEYADPFR